MLLPRSIVLLVLFVGMSTVHCAGDCSLTCLNQTRTRAVRDPPPIYIDDTGRDVLLVFAMRCSHSLGIMDADVSVAVDGRDSIVMGQCSPPSPIAFDHLTDEANFNLTIRGVLVGYAQLSVHADYSSNASQPAVNVSNQLRVDLAVKRTGSVLDVLFTVVVVVLVSIGTFLIGCRLTPHNLVAHLRRPLPILIGLFSQFVCLPLVR
jgi:hypothetical protein